MLNAATTHLYQIDGGAVTSVDSPRVVSTVRTRLLPHGGT